VKVPETWDWYVDRFRDWLDQITETGKYRAARYWGTSVLWGTSVVWGGSLDGTCVLWGTSVVWNNYYDSGFGVVWCRPGDWANSVLWGTSENNPDAAFVQIAGEDSMGALQTGVLKW